MFPLSDSIRSGKIPFFNVSLIAANIVIFYITITSEMTDRLILQYSLTPSTVNFANPTTLIPFFTSLFLHAGLFHIISNMWFLWVFGDNVESGLGKLRFLIVYFGAGLAGGLTQYFLNPDSTIPMLGASGAVSGILAAYVTLYPLSQIRTLVILFFFISFTYIPAVFFIFYWFFIQVVSGIVSLPYSLDTGGVAFWAHVGGFVAGLFLTRFFKSRRTTRSNVIEGEIVG